MARSVTVCLRAARAKIVYLLPSFPFDAGTRMVDCLTSCSPSFCPLLVPMISSRDLPRKIPGTLCVRNVIHVRWKNGGIGAEVKLHRLIELGLRGFARSVSGGKGWIVTGSPWPKGLVGIQLFDCIVLVQRLPLDFSVISVRIRGGIPCPGHTGDDNLGRVAFLNKAVRPPNHREWFISHRFDPVDVTGNKSRRWVRVKSEIQKEKKRTCLRNCWM